MLVLEADPTVKRWERCRSLRILYKKADGTKAHYNPDFVVEMLDGSKELHEVKGSHLLQDHETRRKLEAGEAFCAKRGMVFKVITKSR